MARKRGRYIADLDAHRLERLRRWQRRLSPVPYVGAAVLFAALITILVIGNDSLVGGIAVWVFAGAVVVTGAGVFLQAALHGLAEFERTIQRVEDWTGDDDGKPKKKKQK